MYYDLKEYIIIISAVIWFIINIQRITTHPLKALGLYFMCVRFHEAVIILEVILYSPVKVSLTLECYFTHFPTRYHASNLAPKKLKLSQRKSVKSLLELNLWCVFCPLCFSA